MGCDIHGAIEGYHPEFESWRYCSELWPHVGRSYDTFGSLFGVRGHTGFEPAFADRGLPSEEERSWKLDSRISDYEEKGLIGEIDFHSPSYVMLDELHNLDWDEQADYLDSRVSVLDENGDPTGTKFQWASILDKLTVEENQALDQGEAVPHPNEENDGFLQRRQMTRRDTLSGSWEWVIFDLLPVFAKRYGSKYKIRLTVWFDN